MNRYEPIYEVFPLRSRMPSEAERVEQAANKAWLAEEYEQAARLFEKAAAIRERIERPRREWSLQP